MPTKTERLRAELELAETEERFQQAKATYRAALDKAVDKAIKGVAAADVLKVAAQARRDFELSDTPAVVDYRAAKYELREIRQRFREQHRQTPSGPGDAAPQPATVKAVAESKGR